MKKIVSIILSMLLIVSVFAGCSGGSTAASVDSDKLITKDGHFSVMDASTVSAYEKLCNAVINYDSEVKFNTMLIDGVNVLYYTCFPLKALVKNVEVLEDNTGFSIIYANDIDTHKELIAQFSEKVNSILEACSYTKVSANRFLFNVYTYITSNFTIDNSITNTYDAIINNKGNSSAINSVFDYFINISGGDSSKAINLVGSATVVSIAKLNGEYYYFDAAKEIETTAGEALEYFGMDDSRIHRYVAGSFAYSDGSTIDNITDDHYAKLASSVSYSADEKEISVMLKNNDKYTMDIL
ncbi:MAG: hypothetical protein NC397_06890 [Clostridium sp.]|nr:hypothetical protein [Clostridium sp.]